MTPSTACLAALAVVIVLAVFKALYDSDRAEQRKQQDAFAEPFLALGDQQVGYNPNKALARRMRSPEEFKV